MLKVSRSNFLEKFMAHFIPVCSLDELPQGSSKAIRINSEAIALFRLDDNSVFAVENFCPHIGAPLDNGIVEDCSITCLWHGWSFDLKTGASTNCPGVKIKTYAVKIEEEQVWLELP